jgi:uncharacterized protein (TIGR02453 family)
MAYFTSEYIEFFKELGANNERDWFSTNKKRYETHVKEPFSDFIGELIQAVGKLEPAVNIEPKEAIFRIHRDVRFGKDKTPYKIHSAAVVSPGGRKDHSVPGVYIMMGAEKLMIGGGMYGPSKDEIYAIREAIAKDPKGFNKLISSPKFKTNFGSIQGEENKIIPKEFKSAIIEAPEILKKQWYYMCEMPPETILQEDLIKTILKIRDSAEPFKQFLIKAAKS